MEQTITKPGTSAKDRLAQEFSDEMEQLAQAAAKEQGQPIGTKQASEAEELRLWGRADPLANYDQILQQLLSTGLPQPMVTVPDGANAGTPGRQWLVIAKEQPDLAPQLSQPTQDPNLAHRLAVLCEYPFRMGLLMDIDDPDEQVRKANHLDKLWRASHPQAQAADEATPTPDQVEPQNTQASGSMGSSAPVAASPAPAPAGIAVPAVAPPMPAPTAPMQPNQMFGG